MTIGELSKILVWNSKKRSRNHIAFFIYCFHQVQGNQLELVELGNDNLIQNSVMDSLHEYVDWDQCSK